MALDSNNSIYCTENFAWLSAASAWETTIKADLGKLRLPDHVARRHRQSSSQRNQDGA